MNNRLIHNDEICTIYRFVLQEEYIFLDKIMMNFMRLFQKQIGFLFVFSAFIPSPLFSAVQNEIGVLPPPCRSGGARGFIFSFGLPNLFRTLHGYALPVSELSGFVDPHKGSL